MFSDMMKTWFEAAQFAADSQRVIALRMMRLSSGGPARGHRSAPHGGGKNRGLRRIPWRADGRFDDRQQPRYRRREGLRAVSPRGARQ